jgi:uncharacterized protein (TIGR02391 family)
MSRRTPARRDSVPPTLPPQRAIELLRQQLAQAERIEGLPHDDPEVKKWMLTTENILNATFGEPDGERHENTQNFIGCYYNVLYSGMTNVQHQHNHIRDTKNARAILESCVEQLQILAPPAAAAAPDQYRFHPEIERVSGELFRDGHYKQAAFEAYIRVIDEVKRRSGIAEDGDSLMNRAFGCERQTPVIQFNSLQTDEERDEQKGLMFLFKGIVGLRNSKAHSNRLFNDPSRAHEYLALASLLIRLLEIATVNPNP